MPRFAANLTLLFTEVPMLDRPDWAARCGFDGVEVLVPYDFPMADWERALIGMPLIRTCELLRAAGIALFKSQVVTA